MVSKDPGSKRGYSKSNRVELQLGELKDEVHLNEKINSAFRNKVLGGLAVIAFLSGIVTALIGLMKL